jgi:phenylpropionate dioxygenase-like ring-hydroxylating dioxygenase large terminal subunit
MQPTREHVEAYLNRGLRNYWYPVLASWRLHDAPLGIIRLGERIVLWRDAEGTAHAIEDRCPHRGARLSLGWNVGDRIACWYHGVEVDGTGTVKRVPAVEGCALEGKQCLRTYPCKESSGAIFLYFGDELHLQPCALVLPEQINSPEWGAMPVTGTWHCNYRLAIDNIMDPMHGAYLHAESHSMDQGNRRSEMRIRPTDTGFVFEKVDQRGVNFDWAEWGETGAMWLRLSIPYKKKYGPGGPFFVTGFVTPIDEYSSQLFFWRSRKVTGWQRDAWKFLYKNRLEGLHWAVLEQDREVLETLTPNSMEKESLYQHDTGLARVRRLMQQRAQSDLEALANAHPEAVS